MKTLADRKSQLQTRLDELDKRIHGIEDELESHNNPDWEERAVERETDEVLESMGVRAQAEISGIRQAMARIDAGTYGICVTCGDRISEKRLDLLPHSSVCRGCAGALKHN